MRAGRDQLRLALGPFQNRRLFAEHFLQGRLLEWPEFAAFDARPLLRDLTALWEAESAGLAGANEAQTEARFIQPVLARLGFSYTVQAGLRVAGGRRQPDYALFVDDAARARADLAGGNARYHEAVAVADAKRFDRALDGGRRGGQQDDPVAQIINYISITRCRWAILTNGRLWRLYARDGDLVEAASFEVDLVALIEHADPDAFRFFAAFFGVSALRPDAEGRSFLDRVLSESAASAIDVGRSIEAQIFAAVPLIATGLVGNEERTPHALGRAFDGALVLLYRLLFCLHAEARGLLPVDNPHYLEYSVRRQRERLGRDRDTGRIFASRSDDLYNDLRALFRMIDTGEPALGVSEYNGGLFSAERHPYFENRSVPDDLMAPALDGLYRVGGEAVDYANLSIRHLGTIYERLLEYRLEDAGDGALTLARGDGRHRSGSYFTPGFIVDHIVQRTLDPILGALSERVAVRGLRGDEALQELLSVKVCDPAMGSGHFVVSAAAWIAQWIATDPSYDGELSLVEIQRLVAERCVYGVDLNPMAVELARLSLWLATVREGEPLAFLHNLRCGNSLVGASIDDLLGGGMTVFADRLAQDADAILRGVAAIAGTPSRTGDDVHAKEAMALAVESLRGPLEQLAGETISPALVEEAGAPFHWDLEFPEVFLDSDGRSREGGGFDAIVGNPPYVRIQELGRQLADYARSRYSTARGSFDTYVPFLERAAELLAADGRLGFIVPNKFLRLDYGAGLRRMLASDRLVEEIIDFGDAQIFEGATNYTAIVLLANAGGDDVLYRRITGDPTRVRATLGETTPGEAFPLAELGAGPWILTTGDERRLIDQMTRGSERLDEVARQIFQGLITGADPVYIVEDRGRRGATRLVRSPAGERFVELEPDLLHPLASGVDVDEYAFRTLDKLLLFPYRRTGTGTMELIPWDEIERLPLTAGYLRVHEERLRARERGALDNERWYAFSRTQSLGLHDLPKLGVPRLCAVLRASSDPTGEVYLDNVDVNGLLPSEDGPSLWSLLVLINSQPLDYVFRRRSVPFRGSFLSANKQFIAPLPIRVPSGETESDMEALGRELHQASAAIGVEREGFLTWLGNLLGARVRDLSGWTRLAGYEDQDLASLLEVLRRNGARLRADPSTRAFHDAFAGEIGASRSRLSELRREFSALREAAEDRVADLYELTAAQRRLVAEDSPIRR